MKRPQFICLTVIKKSLVMNRACGALTAPIFNFPRTVYDSIPLVHNSVRIADGSVTNKMTRSL